MHRVDLVVVDNLSMMANLSTELETMDFFRRCRLISEKGTTFIFTIHPRIISEAMLTSVKSMIDVTAN